MNIKEKLYTACQEFVTNKLNTIEKTIKSNKNALNAETKSSAGDKHETGRAMLQLEMEKAGQQLKVVTEMQQQLNRIIIDNSSEIGCLGSVIQTKHTNYYLAISIGKIETSNGIYFAVSVQSPIGKILLGKSKGTHVTFNNQQILIESIT